MNRKNYLLIIAIDHYCSATHPPLNNAKLDAQNVIEVLTSKYNFELIVDPLFDQNATRKNILESLNSLSSSVTSEDNLIVYFAGHGIMHPKTNKGFWVPADASESISDYIPNSSVIDAIEGIDAKHILLISDSCFAGTFLTQTRDASFDTHYSKLEERRSRWLLASGREEKVSDGSPGQGSPFANSLVQFLKEHDSSYLSLSELFTVVQKQTGISSKQQPLSAHIVGVGHEGGQMVLVNTNTSLAPNSNDIIDSELIKVVVPFDLAIKLKENGFNQESIFGYFRINGKLTLREKRSTESFVCSAYTFEEVTNFIPEFIEVDENTYLAGDRGYNKLGKIDEEDYIFAEVTFQRTHVIDTPFMAICRCKGSMVAFSINEEGRYRNLITWGKNQAETAAIMVLNLFKEEKIILPDPLPEAPDFHKFFPFPFEE